MNIQPFFQEVNERFKQSRTTFVIGAVLLVAISAGLFYLIITGRTRGHRMPITPPIVTTTSTVSLVERALDGVLVPEGEQDLATRAVMVENFTSARPLSGPAKANVAIEAPVEGGITRLMLLFDTTSTVAEIGPVRSARPYFVEWADGWNAGYFHVGGSPEALALIRHRGLAFMDIDEMTNGGDFWRDKHRPAPHHIYTSSELMHQAINEVEIRRPGANWHFQDMVTSTKRGGVTLIKIPYGGSYNVAWAYDKDRGVYVRSQAGKPQLDRDGTPVESENVVVIKTEAQVLDSVGRLKVRTLGSGEALIYRDGNRYAARWRRSQQEPMHFESTDGSEILLTRGRTWIQVTTDDLMFAGLSK